MNASLFRDTGQGYFEMAPERSMRVPVRLFGSREILLDMGPEVLQQAANVAYLPGIREASLMMPDAHWGYGFPIGGVAAFDPDQGGVISVGGIGYDIACGVRAMRTGMERSALQGRLQELIDALYASVPAGLGSEGRIKLSASKLDRLLEKGAAWAVEKGYGEEADLNFIEDRGQMGGADPDKVSETAKKRQKRQLGTLGSGNHYLEIQYVDRVYDEEAAAAFGLFPEEVLVTIHSGSRGLGHQIGTDYVHHLSRAVARHNLSLPARELVCAPIRSSEGEDFFRAMCCGVNSALANRQVLGHLAREAFTRVIPQARLDLVYDVSHNTCKIEDHEVDGQSTRLYVHRKGATRAFGPESADIPEAYRGTGQPVIIGGSMGTSSYILAGNSAEQNMAWGSACHGAGRAMSRRKATKTWTAKEVIGDMSRQGILIKAASKKGAAEEAPMAYKDVNLVVEATQKAGLARKVARMRPLACIKG
ncbi:MAG: RtcB family protein [Desulfohalobiaceae bacterium]|nr:RtcB family protein [Desulfohalobiaceae bacterium]